MPPKSFQFDQNSQGKPELGPLQGRPRLRFSLSHSAGCILHAFTAETEVGIDVELIRSDFEPDDLKNTVFTRAEQEWFLNAPTGTERQRRFFQAWTRKEALLKAMGEGISERAKQIETEVGISTSGTNLGSNLPGECQWSVVDLNISDRFAAALAINRTDCAVRFYDFSCLKP